MAKKILIAMDDSENALRAVDFVIDTFTTEHTVTLFSVLPDVAAMCRMESPELTPLFHSEKASFCMLENKKQDLVKAALEKAGKRLVKAGFGEDRVTMECEHKKEGVAQDIVARARSGFDAVVIGRRGISGIREFFLGSVSQKVLSALNDTTVLLVR